MNGGPISIDWIHDNAKVAVLEAFYPSVQGAQAITDAIFGDYNPGGKLPYTIYRSNYINQVGPFISLCFSFLLLFSSHKVKSKIVKIQLKCLWFEILC